MRCGQFVKLWVSPTAQAVAVDAIDGIVNEILELALVNANDYPEAAAKLSDIGSRLQAAMGGVYEPVRD